VHEVSIALTIVSDITERAEAEHIMKITAVNLRVGALTAVVPDALMFAWELTTSGTLAEGSSLSIERVPLAIACAKCDCERTIEDGILPVCPVCSTSSTQILRGRELQITTMEVLYDAEIDRRSTKHSAQKHHART